MARPIVLVHGYNAESGEADLDAVERIYGRLPADLFAAGRHPVAVDVSRYVSVDDGTGIDDLSLALDRALHQREHRALLTDPDGFDAITHSTGALVVRNWVRRYSRKPSPLRHLVHLAGACLGSGWAHVGETIAGAALQGLRGRTRGLAVLDALELASPWTIDLHRHFLQPGSRMLEDYQTREFNLVGSQASAYFAHLAPVRYGREDGSDGVLRAAASNLNWHYLRIGPRTAAARKWNQAAVFSEKALTNALTGEPTDDPDDFYEVKETSRPGVEGRVEVPFALVYRCAHSGGEGGIVSGTQTLPQVLALVTTALDADSPAAYAAAAARFAAATASTRTQAASPAHAAELDTFWRRLGNAFAAYHSSPRAEYDPHAMVVVRVRDQYNQPVRDCRINFNSLGGDPNDPDAGSRQPGQLINGLFQDHHQYGKEAGCHCFYLRTHELQGDGTVVSKLDLVNGVDLEVDSVDPRTSLVSYVPLRRSFGRAELAHWVVADRTVVLDIQLRRLPADRAFQLYRAYPRPA